MNDPKLNCNLGIVDVQKRVTRDTIQVIDFYIVRALSTDISLNALLNKTHREVD